MIIGIGTDILNIHTIEPSVQNPDEPFIRKTYTKKERELICSRPLPLYSFATRFAGKEAIFKCFSVHGDALRLIDIEILETPDGSPTVCLHGKAAELAARKGITNILLSLSYDTDYAVAYATAVAD